MAPLKQTPNTIAEAEAGRNTLLTALFKIVRRDRTKVIANLAGDMIVVARKNTKRGPVRNPKLPPVRKHLPTSSATTSPPNTKRMKAPRTNWVVFDAYIKLGRDVTDWDEQTGDALGCNRDKRNLQSFANVVNILYGTLKYYLCTKKSKCRVVGISVGRASLFSKDQKSFLAYVLA